MKKDAAPSQLGSFGGFDYEPDFDPNDTVRHGRGRETSGALEDRNGSTQATQTVAVSPYESGALHHRRSLVDCDGGDKRSLRDPSIGEGVSLREKMRADLDDDIAAW